jgi:hypothetical protein
MNAKYFEVYILQNKDKALHTDVTKPQISVKAVDGIKGKYFHVSIVAPAVMENGFMIQPQLKRIAFPVFETGIRSLTFNRIQEILSDPEAKGFDLTPLKDTAKIHRTELGIAGDLRIEETGFPYEVIINGKKQVRTSVQEFIFKAEEETGQDELIMAAAHRKAAQTRIVSEEDKVAGTTVGE